MRDSMTIAAEVIANARTHHRSSLLETEAFALLESVGIPCPRRLFARDAAAAAALDTSVLGTTRVVVKVMSPSVAHKSDVGGVAFVPNERGAIVAAVTRMAATFTQADFAGCSISECIDFDHAPGGEWLVGLRWTDEFGPVITVGAGGVSTEFLAAALAEGRDLAAFAPDRLQRDVTERRLKRLAWTPLLTGGVRKQPARASLDELFAVVERFAALAPLCSPDGITELEVNPLVPHDGR
ncbi:MAG: acetate--CoA ligase family protein, partial [Acidobacteria bacterium]|nr:acetate--CoA ligase family protein [Acidobacteriota bacterium]